MVYRNLYGIPAVYQFISEFNYLHKSNIHLARKHLRLTVYYIGVHTVQTGELLIPLTSLIQPIEDDFKY